MNILVDIGNTDTKYINSEELGAGNVKRVSNNKLTSDWLSKNWLDADKIILASVSNNALGLVIVSWANQNNTKLIQVSTDAKAFGVRCGYDNFRQLGVDRWLAVLGAYKLYPKKNVLIIDAGTATTVDVIDRSGQHQGGWILPGIDMMFDSVLAKTANVKAQKNDYADISFAKNTSDNVNHACWAATIGMVEVAIKEAQEQGYCVERILLTGGYGKSLSDLLEVPCEYIPQLIFYGLEMYQ